MKLMVLAAGEGTRLRPLTNDRPKCMVEFQEKPMIDYIVENALKCEVPEVNVILGYRAGQLKSYLSKYSNTSLKFFYNTKYEETNMVYTLFCAENQLQGDVIISYSDIVYNAEVLEKIISTNESAIIIDRNWKDLWTKRMENPLDDAETLKLDAQEYVIEVGKKPRDYSEIQGQYIGLIKISEKDIEKVKEIYHNLNKEQLYDGKSFDKMFMTSFLQILINQGIRLKAVTIDGGWIEIDSIQDLENLKDYTI